MRAAGFAHLLWLLRRLHTGNRRRAKVPVVVGSNEDAVPQLVQCRVAASPQAGEASQEHVPHAGGVARVQLLDLQFDVVEQVMLLAESSPVSVVPRDVGVTPEQRHPGKAVAKSRVDPYSMVSHTYPWPQ